MPLNIILILNKQENFRDLKKVLAFKYKSIIFAVKIEGSYYFIIINIIKMKHFFAIILLSLLVGKVTLAYDFSAVCESGQTLYYDITSNTEPYTVEITSENTSEPYYTAEYSSPSDTVPYFSTYPAGALMIPSFVIYNNINYSVTSISSYAFYGCTSLTSITIPNSVETIGESAFENCSGITTLTIGRSVSSIGNNAFRNCRNLNTVNYNATACSYMGDLSNSVFPNCFSFTTLIIGDNVTKIPDYAFQGCKITGDLIIPDSVITIGYRSFISCQGLTAVTIGESVQGIGGLAFSDCHGLTTINLNAVRIIDYYFDASENSFFLYNTEAILNIGENVAAFPRHIWGENYLYFSTINVSRANTTFDSRDDCNAIIETSTNTLIFGCSNTTIPNSVTNIANDAFYNCKTLTGITIPNSITSIGNNAFYGCIALTEIIIPNSVTSLGERAFYGCRGLSSVSIGNSVENMGERVFFNCNDITSIYLNSTEPPAVRIFSYPTYEDATLWVPCGSLAAYDTWNDFVDIRESRAYMLRLSSANPRFGTAGLTQQPDCTDGIAIISATANEHCHFVQWNDGNTDNPRTITITEDTTYTASFALDQHTITVVTGDEAMGTVSAGGTYDYGTEIQILATANEHYHFVQWSDGYTGNPRTIVVERDATYTASFALDQYTVTVMSADETLGYVFGEGTYDYGAEIRIVALARDGYAFLSWNDGNTETPRTIIVESDTTFTAIFATARTVTIESSDNEMGYVIGSGEYAEGAEIEITAVPYEGYRFDHWVDVDNPSRDFNTDNPRTIVVSTDVTYMAVFTDVVGIEDNGVPKISVFPNPATDIVEISATQNITRIEVVSATGQIMHETEVNEESVSINVENLPSGTYFVRIFCNPDVIVKKLVVM